MKKILVTGFEQFDNEKINPSLEALKLLPNTIDNIEVIKLELPTVVHKSLDIIREAIEMYQPDFVLSIGQAGGRAKLTVERVAININDFRVPDNEANQPIDTPIFEGAPDAYLLNSPIKAMVKASNDIGVPASVSNSAGTFVCNHVAYGVAHIVNKDVKTSFIHIPYLPQQALDKENMPSMDLDLIVKGVIACIKAMINTKEDIKITGGSLN